MTKLIKSLIALQAELPPAHKDAKGNYGKYADLASVWDVIRKPLKAHGLAITQQITTAGQFPTLLTTLWHESGENITSEMPIFGSSTAIAFGSGLTYARRYSITALLGVIADDDDGQAASVPPQNGAMPPKQQAEKRPVMSADMLKKRLNEAAQKNETGEEIQPKTLQSLAISMNQIVKNDVEQKRILGYLMGVESKKDLTEVQARVLLTWAKLLDTARAESEEILKVQQ